MNFVYGKNETGKSTLQNFIKASLYGFVNQRTDGEGRPPEKTKYKPWDSGNYGGVLEVIKDDGHKLRIEKDFDSNETQVFDENLSNISSTFDYLSRTGLKVGENLLGIDRECFENSVFIGQGNTAVAQTDRNHLFEKIVNLMNTGREDESASVAIAAISKAQRNLGNNRTQDKPYNKALREVKTVEAEFSSAKQKNIEMSSNMERKAFLEEEIERLESDIIKAESMEQAERLYEKIKELENTKRRYLSLVSEISILDKEIYEAKNKQSSLNTSDADEQEVLLNLQKTASSSEKQKRIPEGNHERELVKLKRNNSTKNIVKIMLAIIILISVPLAIVINPLLFIITALLVSLLVILIIKKPQLTIEQLLNYIKLEDECSQDLAGINEFIVRSGYTKASDFQDAEIKLNSIYKEIKEKISLTSLINNKESRRNGQKALAVEILGNFKSLSDLDNELSGLTMRLEKTGSAKSSNNMFSSSDLKVSLSRNREELAGISRLLEEYSHDENELAEIEERLMSANEFLETINEEKKALDLTDKLIKSASESLRGNIFPVINEKMGELISRITKGRHSLLLAGLGKTMNTEFDDSARTIWNFSDGTIDQMYLSLRLAAADAMSEHESLPILIDEAFAYYDEDRISAVFNLLHELSASHQIIVFTCKESELRIAGDFKDVNIIEL